MEYFGTNLTEHGHYTWDLKGTKMVKIGLLPKHTPFNPEELTRHLPKGHCVFYEGGDYTVFAISGSPLDTRPGTKSVFWVRENLSREQMIDRIKENKTAMSIINAMNFDVKWTISQPFYHASHPS
jgi:hypothetical protein